MYISVYIIKYVKQTGSIYNNQQKNLQKFLNSSLDILDLNNQNATFKNFLPNM